ncbi:MAG: glycosyltransferase [Alphaproteobacteria bacterium]|nr:glycosyltransferase [Alphaproteobacteria bacterium]
MTLSSLPAAAAGRRNTIVFVINSLGPGGAERVLENLLHAAPHQHWTCHLVLLDQETEWRSPPDFVQVHRLDCRMGLRASLSGLTEVLERIRPDLVVSFLVRANVAAIIASGRVGAPCIISERAHLSTHLKGKYAGPRRWVAFAAPRLIYPRADQVIAVSEGVRSDLIRNFAISPKRVTSIANPFDLERIAQLAMAEPEIALPQEFMVSTGRLVGSKGFEDLLEAYWQANPAIPLCILGEGPDRDRLEQRIADLNLKGRVILAGYVKNPFAVVGRASLFVSASHCEGFPNAMAEAMALGRPVIATDCPSGPAEILEGVESTGTDDVYEARYGLLTPVGRPDALAKAMSMMNDPDVRQRYSTLARQRMEDFHIDRIADRYWQTFANGLSLRGRRSDGRQARPSEPAHAEPGAP